MKLELYSIERPSKVELAVKALKDLAKDLGEGKKFPKIRDLCKALKISSATLNLALDILEKDGVIVRKHARGIYVSKGAFCKRIAVVFDHIINEQSSPYFKAILDSFRSFSKEKYMLDYYFDLSVSEFYSNKRLEEDLKDGKINGVLWFGGKKSNHILIRNKEIPLVSYYPGYLSEYMLANDFPRMINLGISYLKHRGSKRIGLFGIDQGGWMRYRLLPSIEESFRNALVRESLNYIKDFVFILDKIDPLTISQKGREIVFQNSDIIKKMDGVLITDDILGRGILSAMNIIGLMPGKDIEVVSHANRNSEVLLEYRGVIPVIEFDPVEYANKMAAMLVNCIEGRVQKKGLELIQPTFIQKNKIKWSEVQYEKLLYQV